METHILGVGKLFAVPLPEDGSQFSSVFELGHPSEMEILPGGNGLTSQIDNLDANQGIIHIVHPTFSLDVA